MSTLSPNSVAPITPSASDVQQARETSRLLAKHRNSRRATVHFHIQKELESEPYIVPMSAFRLFIDILTQMGDGNTFALIPVEAELTTQQAAELLNVSRPFFIGLLEAGKIPFRKVGRHRRVLAKSLLEYKQLQEVTRATALDELAALGQELNPDY